MDNIIELTINGEGVFVMQVTTDKSVSTHKVIAGSK
jgi:hypothetical protein